MQFGPRTVERIHQAVLTVEGQRQVVGANIPRTYVNDETLDWYKLKETLYAGADANAAPCVYNSVSGSYVEQTDANSVVKVYDVIGSFYAPKNTYVLCRFMGKSDGITMREVVWGNPARLCTGSTTNSVASNAASFTVHNVVPLDADNSPVDDSNEALTVQNPYGWQADTNGRSCMFALSHSGQWVFVQGGCWPPPGA